jgi:hypothetical protein
MNTAAPRETARKPVAEIIARLHPGRQLSWRFLRHADRLYPGVQQRFTACTADGVAAGDMMTEGATALSAGRLRTPSQIEQHLTLAFKEGFRIGEKPVITEAVETVLSHQLDDLEPKLTRRGCDMHSLAEQFNAKPAEIRRFLRGELTNGRLAQGCQSDTTPTSRHLSHRREPNPMIAGRSQIIRAWSHPMWVWGRL